MRHVECGNFQIVLGIYKGFFSIVSLAIVDYDYKFLFADVGCQGRISDGGVYRNSFFYRATQDNSLDLPPDKPLPSSKNPFYDSGKSEPMRYVCLLMTHFH